jgi:hypothetical protein
MIDKKNIISVEYLTVKSTVTGMIRSYTYLQDDEGGVTIVRSDFLTSGINTRIEYEENGNAKKIKRDDVKYFKKE